MAQDKISIDRLRLLHPILVNEAMDIYDDICVALTGRAICRISYSVRSFSEQNALYALGRTVVNPNGKSSKRPMGSIVTNAKGGESYHNYALAVDIVLLKDTDGNGTYESASWETNVDFDGDGENDWMEVVKIFKMYGWEWGGDWKFKDAPHFQKTFGQSIKQLQKKYNNKEVIPSTNYVKL